MRAAGKQWAKVLACIGAAACGGRDGSSQSLGGPPLIASEAGLSDATASSADGGADPCVTSQAYLLQPITSLSAGVGGPSTASEIAGASTGYVSYDLTGGAISCEPDVPEDGGMYGCTNNCGIPGFNADELVTGLGGCTTGYATSGELMPAALDRCGDKYALHMRATELTGWGMNLGIEFRQNSGCNMVPTPPLDAGSDAGLNGEGSCWFDASSWTGLAFWARLGSSDSATTALVTIGDPLTSSVLGGTPATDDFNAPTCGDPACATDTAGNTINAAIPCSVSPCANKGTCCDPFGKAITLSSDWQFYTLPFAEMKQKGFGLFETTPDLRHFLGVKFNLSKGQLGVADFDVWVDNFSFYKSK